MHTITKAICIIGIVVGFFLAGTIYLCTHGIQENGRLSIAMTSSSKPVDSDLVGRTIPVDGKSSIKVTAISRNLKADGSVENYMIHADLLCRGKQWFSPDDRSWKHEFSASARKVHEVLRTESALPDHAVTKLNSELLLP